MFGEFAELMRIKKSILEIHAIFKLLIKKNKKKTCLSSKLVYHNDNILCVSSLKKLEGNPVIVRLHDYKLQFNEIELNPFNETFRTFPITHFELMTFRLFYYISFHYETF